MGVNTHSPLGISESILSLRHTLNPAGTALLRRRRHCALTHTHTHQSLPYSRARSPSSSSTPEASVCNTVSITHVKVHKSRGQGYL